MLLQQQIAKIPNQNVADGWTRGLQVIQKIAANSRYFTDSSTKVPWDVQSGDAAAGMCIDFYGRFQSEAVRKPDGSSRLQYVSPAGGSSVGADPPLVTRDEGLDRVGDLQPAPPAPPVTANAFKAPDSMCGCAGGSAAKATCVVPLRIAWMAGPAPEKGTCVI